MASTTVSKPGPQGLGPLHFRRKTPFSIALKAAVQEYLAERGATGQDDPRMYRKCIIILGWFFLSYACLIFVPMGIFGKIVAGCLVLLAVAAIGFNIQHDGSHGAVSRDRRINGIAAATMDLMGASSNLWVINHVVLHHGGTGVIGHDHDVELGPLARMIPAQRRLWVHRWQHLYIWFFYGFTVLRWHLVSDFRCFWLGRLGNYPIPKMTTKDLMIFWIGKATFFTMAFGIPMLIYPVAVVVTWYVIMMYIAGLILALVFQCAHCVEDVEFPVPDPTTAELPYDYMEHMVHTTMDFAPRNKLLCWFVGGLNFQVVHHLFQGICHTYYPELAPIIKRVCRQYGITYHVAPTFLEAIARHYRWLRFLGQAA